MAAISNFIPTIWSARLLAHLDNIHVYANLVNRDYEGDIKQQGDTVKINQIGDITIGTYAKSSIGSPEDLTNNQTTLTIDQAKYFNFAIDDVDAAQVKPKLMDAAMARAAYGLNDVSDSYIAGIMAAGATNSGSYSLGTDATPLVPTSSTAVGMLFDMAADLTEKNVPTTGRWVVVPAWFHSMLCQSTQFIGYGNFKSGEVLVNGSVGRCAGFEVYVSNNVPNTSSAKYKILAGTNAGCTYAEQISKVEAYRPEELFSDAVKGLHLYGASVSQPNALTVLTANRS